MNKKKPTVTHLTSKKKKNWKWKIIVKRKSVIFKLS